MKSVTIEKRELLLAVAISLVLLVFDISSVSLFPTVWCDEVSFAEPAINFANQGLFETYVWPAQPAGTFWTANAPLYPLILSSWIHGFGHSLLALRSLNYALITVACLGIWFLACQFHLSRNRTSRLLLIPLIHLAYGVSFAYRSIRPDILGLFILVLYVATLRLNQTRIRHILLAACGIAAVWTGPQLGIIIGIGAILVWQLRWVQFKDVAATAIGGILGTISLACLLHLNHAIPDFMASIALGRTGGIGTTRAPTTKAWQTLISYVKDYSLIPLLAVSAIFTIKGWKFFDKETRQQTRFLWFWVLIIPALLNSTSTYGYYYCYMVYIPTCLLLILLSDRIIQANPTSKWRPEYLLFTAAAAAIAIGLPTRMVIVINYVKLESRREMIEKMRRFIHNDDVVLVENAAFFEAKMITPRVYGELYYRFGKITNSEKSTVTVLIVSPKDFDRYQSQMGGIWEAQGEPFGDTRIARFGRGNRIIDDLLDRHFSTPQMARSPLQIYRKAVPPTR